MAAPSAPAQSPLGMTWIGMLACSSRWAGMPLRISEMNQSWNSREVSSTPPPTMRASGIEGVDHLVKEEAESVSLHFEYRPAHRVAALGVSASLVGGFGNVIQLRELVIRILFEEERHHVHADGCERAKRLEVADAAAVAAGVQTGDLRNLGV